MQRRWLLAVGCWLWPGTVTAQDSVQSGGASDRTAVGSLSTASSWWVGAWAGAALHSKFHTRIGPRRRDFYEVGIRFGRELAGWRLLAVDYFGDVIPLLVSTDNPVAFRAAGSCPTADPCDLYIVMETATARGFGVAPIGLQLRAFPRKRVQLLLGLSLGAALYDKPVPDPGEKRLNFMGEVGVGFQMRLGRSALQAGIRHNHTSNANTGRINPGLDSRVLHLGVTRSVGGRPPS